MWREIQTMDLTAADIAVFGVAVDENCSVGKGAAAAPSVIRECSECLPPYTVKGEEITARLYDLGDVTAFDYQQVFEKLRLCKDKKCTVVLGGDHSISILSEKAFRALHDGKVGLIHIDAHADICDVYQGNKNSHACVNRRALENGFSDKDVAMVGIRSYERQEVEFLQDSDICLFTAEEVLEKGADWVLRKLVKRFKDYDAIYLSFDVDSVDPAYAPGTGTPEAFGLDSICVLRLLTGIFKRLPVKVMDVVEVAPPLETNNITVWLVLKYLLEIFKLL